MAISNLQQARQNYGLGSFVKKAVKKITNPITKISKKIVPKEIAGIMRVAAPFLPPGYREAAYLMGTARQTGRISPMDLALAAAPTFFKSDMGQGITNKIGGMNVPGSGGKTTFQKLLIGGDGEAGLIGNDGNMFKIGGNNEVGILDNKIGQALFGKEKNGKFSYDLKKLFGIGTGLVDYVNLKKALDEEPEPESEGSDNSEDAQFYAELFDKLDPNSFAIDKEYVLKNKAAAANGGLMRTNFNQGGAIFPRIDELGNDITSAEQELANISQRLDTAQSSLGGQGGQSGGGIMDSSIAPDSPFPNIAEATPGGQVQATPFPDITEAISNNPAQSTPGTTDSSYNQNFNNIFTANTGGLQKLPGFNNRRPMPFELQGPGTGNAPPMTQLEKIEAIKKPGGTLNDLYLSSGVGPRIPRPAVDLPGGMPSNMGRPLLSAVGNGIYDMPGYGNQTRLTALAEGGMPEYESGLMRTNYAMGSDDEPLPEDPTKPVNPFGPKPIGPFPSDMAGIPKDLDLEKAIKDFIDFNGREPKDMQELLKFFDVKQQAAGGGLMRSNYAFGDMAMNQAPSMGMGMSPNLGSRPTAEESGLGGLPIEADLRYTGGFMPYGAVEKADDVPARLSKNEFVFTADAVRAAGGGSVQKGAKKMYDTMKQLEKKPEAKGAMA